MIERLLYRNGTELGARRIQKGAAGGGQPDAVYFLHAAAAQALVYGVVLAVDGQQRLALAARLGCNQLAGGDQTFFIGYAHYFSGFHRFVSCFQAGHAYDGADHEVGLREGRDPDRASSSVDDFDFAETGLLETCAENIGVGFGCDRDYARPPAARLLESRFQIGAGSQRDDLKTVWVGLSHAQRATAD